MERLTIPGENLEDLDSRKLPAYGKLYWKLNNYEDLVEQGKMLKLPCAMGDTVWFIKSCFSFMSKPKAEKVRKIEIIPGEIIFITENRRFDIGSVGKTVFLTREEAEAALKKLSAPEQQ